MRVVPRPGLGRIWSGMDDDAPTPRDFVEFVELSWPMNSVARIVAVAVWGVSAVNRGAVSAAEPIVRCVRTQVAAWCLGCARSVAR